MASADDGGPIYPVSHNSTTTLVGGKPSQGLSLLDYFAGQALANPVICESALAENNARYAYDSADAMLAERKRRMEETR